MSHRYDDEVTSIQQRALQSLQELKFMDGNLKRLAPAVEQLKVDAQNFKPPRESHDIIRMNPNDRASDPREELQLLRHKLRGAVSDLERAAALATERRDALVALLE